MSHYRAQIVDAVAAAVAAGVPDLAGRVYRSRGVPVADLPAALIYWRSETVAPGSGRAGDGRVPLARSVRVYVHLRAAGRDVDGDLDALALAVETALGADYRLSGLVPLGITLIGAEKSELTQTDRPVGDLVLGYEARYRTSNTDPETGLD